MSRPDTPFVGGSFCIPDNSVYCLFFPLQAHPPLMGNHPMERRIGVSAAKRKQSITVCGISLMALVTALALI